MALRILVLTSGGGGRGGGRGVGWIKLWYRNLLLLRLQLCWVDQLGHIHIHGHIVPIKSRRLSVARVQMWCSRYLTGSTSLDI